MKQDRSYGIIPLRKQQNKWEVLLIQHHAGHWAFPKGHAELNESPQQTAKRELLEETNLHVEQFLSLEPFNETYYFTFKGEKIHKQVNYYLALVVGEVKIQELEIQASRWITLENAEKFTTFSEGKKICQQVILFLANYSLNNSNC
jgi:bis(5'-nucleosidyl)-tetraphosphatase